MLLSIAAFDIISTKIPLYMALNSKGKLASFSMKRKSIDQYLQADVSVILSQLECNFFISSS